MKNIKLKEVIKLIFLPAVLLSVFLSCGSTLFCLARNSMVGSLLNPFQLPALKTAIILPQIILVLALLIFSKNRPFEKVFRTTLKMLIGTISLLAGLVFFQEHLQLQGVAPFLRHLLPESMVHVYEPLLSNWAVSLFYIVSSIFSFNLFSLLIWGFINRLTSASEGVKYYLSLTFVLGLVGALITNLALWWMKPGVWPFMAMVIPAIAFMVCALITFNWAWKRLPEDLILPKVSSTDAQSRFPFLSGAYLLAGCLMIKNLLTILFKFQLKTQLSSPVIYSKFMGLYSTTVGTSTVIVSILWLALGTWLLVKKSWRTTVICGSISILLGGIVFFRFSSCGWISVMAKLRNLYGYVNRYYKCSILSSHSDIVPLLALSGPL